MNHLFTNKTIRLPEKQITLCFFGDCHFGTTSFDEDRFDWFLTKSSKMPNPYYLGMGDYTDFASYGENKKLHQGDMHDTTMDRLDMMVMEDNRLFAQKCKQMRGRLLGLIGGNHQYSMVGGKTTDEDLAERLGTTYLGWLTVLMVQLTASPGHTMTFTVFGCHGSGGGKLLGTSINKVIDMQQIIPNADIYVQGHDHQRMAVPKSVIHIVPNANPRVDGFVLKQKRQYFVRSGSFQKSYERDKSGFAQGRLMKPADLGAVYMNISTHRGKNNDILDIESIV
jgi:hypothetical protein